MPGLTQYPLLVAVAIFSMGIQFAAAGMALRLIRVTGHHLAWIIIALANCLQAARRGITLAALLAEDGQNRISLGDQVMGLAISVCMLAGIALIGPIFRRVQFAGRQLREAGEEKDRIIRELRSAKARISVLSGLLPICSYCKRIRNDEGYWEQVETYIREHSGLNFSHGICPDCMTKVMAEMGDSSGE